MVIMNAMITRGVVKLKIDRRTRWTVFNQYTMEDNDDNDADNGVEVRVWAWTLINLSRLNQT